MSNASNRRMSSTALASVLAFIGLSGACGATATLVRHEPGGGQMVLRGPYMPAMHEAPVWMLEHCMGRFVVKEGKDSRDLSYECASRTHSKRER